jgi:ATP synthase protein I
MTGDQRDSRRPDSRGEGTPPRRGGASTGGEYAGVGIQLGMTIVLSALLGYWLDKKLGTGPWLLIVLVFVGAAAGFYSLYRRVIGGGRK